MWATNSQADDIMSDTCMRKTWIEETCKRVASKDDFLEKVRESGDAKADEEENKDNDDEVSDDDVVENIKTMLADVSIGGGPAACITNSVYVKV